MKKYGYLTYAMALILTAACAAKVPPTGAATTSFSDSAGFTARTVASASATPFPNGTFVCPDYSGTATMSNNPEALFFDNWQDNGGSFTVNFAAKSVYVQNNNEVNCVYPSRNDPFETPHGNDGIVRMRIFSEYSR